LINICLIKANIIILKIIKESQCRKAISGNNNTITEVNIAEIPSEAAKNPGVKISITIIKKPKINQT